MTSPSPKKSPNREVPPAAVTSSPRFHVSTPTAGAQRKIGIAVDLSDESAVAVKWAVQNYLRPGDAVVLVHVRSTSILYGADWGAMDLSLTQGDVCENVPEHGRRQCQDSRSRPSPVSQQKMEEDFDILTNAKANDLAEPLVEAGVPFKIHIVKDHDMKERLCLEVERLGLSAVVMGSRGFGASRRSTKGRLGSVSDYCVHHCVCPVIVVRYPEDKDAANVGQKEDLAPVVEVDEEQELHDSVRKTGD